MAPSLSKLVIKITIILLLLLLIITNEFIISTIDLAMKHSRLKNQLYICLYVSCYKYFRGETMDRELSTLKKKHL